jgi:four helix bundle protein
MRKELEDRLINLSLKANQLCRHMDGSFISVQLTKQIIRSATSTVLNYGEAQGAESKADFAHKVSMILKELRETQIRLKLLTDSVKEDAKDDVDFCQDECAQLVAIFHKTVITVKANK